MPSKALYMCSSIVGQCRQRMHFKPLLLTQIPLRLPISAFRSRAAESLPCEYFTMAYAGNCAWSPAVSSFWCGGTVHLKNTVRLPVNCYMSPNQESEQKGWLSSSRTSTYTWCTGLGALGLMETAYLTYTKLTDVAASCPLGGGGCSDVRNSDYAVVYGIPLSLIGLITYGLVTCLGFQLSTKNFPFGLGESDGCFILLGTTTAMAAASSYLLYILKTEFAETSCSYCLTSAFLSFTLFFLSVKDLGWKKIRELGGMQLAVAAIVIALLNNAHSDSHSVAKNFVKADLLPVETAMMTKSSPVAMSLANHLRAVGAKMYGAFWCSHCLEQKKMFGREAAEILNYVECFPDGVGQGRKIAEECEVAGLQGFPTWAVKGKVLNGVQTFLELMEASEFFDSSHTT